MKVLKLRKKMGLTQADLADRCGTTQQQIAKIENLAADPRFGTLSRLAEALHCEVHELFFTPEEFEDLVNTVIKNRRIDLQRTVMAIVASYCLADEQIPSFDPLWNRCKVKNNKIEVTKRRNK